MYPVCKAMVAADQQHQLLSVPTFGFFLNYFKGLRHEDYLSNIPLKVLWCFLLSLRYTSEGPGLMTASELALEKLWGMSSDVQSIFMALITELGGETSKQVGACISGSRIVSNTSLLPSFLPSDFRYSIVLQSPSSRWFLATAKEKPLVLPQIVCNTNFYYRF